MSWDIDSFRKKLEQQHKFPGEYMFKFIVPIIKKNDVIALLPDGNLTFKMSKNNQYISITLVTAMSSSDDVIMVYSKLHQIPGIVAL